MSPDAQGRYHQREETSPEGEEHGFVTQRSKPSSTHPVQTQPQELEDVVKQAGFANDMKETVQVP